MQAFQPRPIQLPGGQPSNFGPSFEPGSGIDFGRMMRIGLIIGLVIFAIFIISVGKSYTAKQHNVVQNQDVRPLGQVHTENVQVTMPTASELIQLPLFIQGTARLDWFADGIFPIEVRDGKNTILASGFAIADIIDPNTQTANFRAVIEGFDVRPETRIGRVILYRQVLRENPGIDDIASIGIDFSRLGDKWQKPVVTTTTSSTTTETKTNGLDSLWTDLNPSKKTETKTTTQTKKTTSTKYQKVVGGPFTCANGIDDDKDGQLDNDDPSCHTDGYPANARTYDGDLDEAKRAPTERDADGNLPDSDYEDSGATGNTNNSPNSSSTTLPVYNQSNTVWQGSAKIRVQD